MLSLLMIQQLCLFQMTHIIAYSKNPLIILSWTNVNGMVINTSKTQKMVVYFGKQLCVDDIPLIDINGRHIKRFVSCKLLGVVISSDLTWDAHVPYILSKSSKRIYCILNLCKAGVPTRDIVYIYCSGLF